MSAYLRQLSVGPDRVVGVLAEPGPLAPTAILAILRAGGAYLPLDPAAPADRIAYLLADAGCDLVVTTPALADRMPGTALAVCPDDPFVAAALARQPADEGALVRADDLAYVIYTSGSTGRPKGTLVPHRGAVNLVRHGRSSEYGVGPGDRVLQFASITFDVSVSDLFGALGNGATLVCARRSTLVDPRALTALMRVEGVTVADLPPAVLPLLDPADVPALRLLHVGGEALTHAQARRWRTPDRMVYHRYGPTEATVCCTEHPVPDGGGTAASR